MSYTRVEMSIVVNGNEHQEYVEPRTTLADLLRERLNLTATHLGCEHGVCGACTVLLDGHPVRSCILFAVACDGAEITTVEGLEGDDVADRLRAAFRTHHGLQCGFCTSGMIVSGTDILKRKPNLDEATCREELSGNLCRCTGYVGIVQAMMATARDA